MNNVYDDEEIWKAIPQWEGFYEVSNHGRVRSNVRLSRVNSVDYERKRLMGGIIRKQTNRRNYKVVTLTANGKRKSLLVHRAVLSAFVGEMPKNYFACHKDNNPANNHISNLYWGTHQDNMSDRKKSGNYFNGENHPMAKLTNADALDIYKSKENRSLLSKKYNVNYTKIWAIQKGKTWSSITGHNNEK